MYFLLKINLDNYRLNGINLIFWYPSLWVKLKKLGNGYKSLIDKNTFIKQNWRILFLQLKPSPSGSN